MHTTLLKTCCVVALCLGASCAANGPGTKAPPLPPAEAAAATAAPGGPAQEAPTGSGSGMTSSTWGGPALGGTVGGPAAPAPVGRVGRTQVDIAPPPSSAVNPGLDNEYCPSGQQPPCN